MGVASSDHGKYARAGYALVVIGLGGFLGWASVAEISAAVVAPGSVVVVSNRKVIQHLEGGIVGSVLVRDGVSVSEGDVLVRLDATRAEADLEVLRGQLDAGLALQARLEAERDGLPSIAFPEESFSPDRDSVAASVRSQKNLFEARRKSVAGQLEMLARRMEIHSVRAEAYRRQSASIASEMASYREQLDGVSLLTAKGFASRSAEREIERRILSLETAMSEAEAEVASAESLVIEAELEKAMVEHRVREEVSAELPKVVEANASLREQIAIAMDVLSRKEIRAPQDGVVQALAFHAHGAVIRPGEAVMELVPVLDDLVVETRFPAVSIDQVKVGMTVEVRFPSFSSRMTPVLTGTVTGVSPDALPDSEGRRLAFVGRVEVVPESIPDELAGRLQPGMPAEVVVATEARTVLSYLVKPLTDALARTFRER